MKRFADKLLTGDVYLLYLMNHRFRCKILDWLMPIITHLGSALFTISFTAVFILFGNGSGRILGYELALSLISSHFLVHFLKRKVNRPRPL